MTVNKITFECECRHKESDVQCKIFKNGKTKIRIKCLKCNYIHFLDANDSRCMLFFK